MQSLVERLKPDLEARGEYVVRANISSGWFAMYPSTWMTRISDAKHGGRDGPNLVVYRTKSDIVRDHHVIPYGIIRSLLVEETIAHSKAHGTRWNLALKDNQLRVTHRAGKLDVGIYFGAQLLGEEVGFTIPEEIEPAQNFSEGAIRQIHVNAYERDREARNKCIAHYGRRCVVCHMAFGEVYGSDAASIIHVHHLVPLSEIRRKYLVDPITDLRPVCPNCHAVIHSRTPPYPIEEVIELFVKHQRPSNLSGQ